jgi:hypothetical protein
LSTPDSNEPIAESRDAGTPEGPGLEGPPGEGQAVHILGVDYVHTVTAEGGDLYLTEAGLSRARHLQPESWFEREWFRTHREVLRGTGAVYVVPTRPVGGESLGLLVKFNRAGERVPVATKMVKDLLDREFNGPFEEFALVEELRGRVRGTPGRPILTQVPLAIYVPPEETQPSQSGRFQWRIDRAIARHPGVALDILRDYIMVYSWLPGVDASEAHEMGLLTDAELRTETARATEELRQAGFTVLDMKDAHVIVRLASATDLETRGGRVELGVIDYELMERTAEYEREVQEGRRKAYARRRQQVWHRKEGAPRRSPLPAHLDATRILGVDYIQGRTESTGGVLWVVGRDPDLFDLFLPERWRTTPQLPLPPSRETYSTESKDHIRLVWKVSSVGERPEVATRGAPGFRVLAYGVNSPFEEVALAHWLHRQGVSTVLPLAIYRTGHHSLLHDWPYDTSRYRSHEGLQMPDGTPVLEMRRNYITLWEQWHGPDPRADEGAPSPYSPLDADRAVAEGWATADEASELVRDFRTRLLAAGVEDLNLLAAHLLVARGEDGALRREESGAIAARLCNLEFLRSLGAG